MKDYITDLNKRAYVDSMTHVRNKGAYSTYTEGLQQSLESNNELEFAVGMFDCDNLKKINDRYGHEKGDVYLKTASHQICNTFNHSPVFRLGGDEFAVVLQQADFLRREKLLEEFDRTSTTTNAENADSWNRVSIAKGCAVYDPAIDKNTADVLRRADEAMYRDKNAHHAGTQER
jgi:diguanylate cyclase (GGDEF)-like protein